MHGGNGKVAYIDTEGTLYAFYSFKNYDELLIDNLWLFFQLIFTYQSFYVYLQCSRPDRIVAIAERFGMDPGAVLDNVSVLCFMYVS